MIADETLRTLLQSTLCFARSTTSFLSKIVSKLESEETIEKKVKKIYMKIDEINVQMKILSEQIKNINRYSPSCISYASDDSFRLDP